MIAEPSAQWDSFVFDSLAAYDPEDRLAVKDYLQEWAGAALTGDCVDGAMVFMHGRPGTGKSTFCETLAACFGDYSATVQGSRVAGEDHQHLQWLAGLNGKRLLYVDEVPERGKWRTDVLSTMIEGGTLEAHKMRQNSFNFQSTLQVIITGNFKPRANAVGGIWRRLRMIRIPERTRRGQPSPGQGS